MSQAGSKKFRNALLWVECLILFFVLPGALYFFRHELAFRVVPLVLVLALGCGVYLSRRPGFSGRVFYVCQDFSIHLRRVLYLFLPSAAVLLLTAWLFLPENFLRFPLMRPGIWALVMLLYPLLAAYPQEIVFRGFFFERYKDILPSQAAMLAVNGLSFGLAHALYGNWLAPTLAALGGALFGFRYLRSGSLLIAGLEHGLWGNLLFTSGWGWYFYSGAIQ
jgi:membrane protease YdiL (CAAX protease family)